MGLELSIQDTLTYTSNTGLLGLLSLAIAPKYILRGVGLMGY